MSLRQIAGAGVFAMVLGVACLPAWASQHLWGISELYSNADGTVQFLELFDASDFEHLVGGFTIFTYNSDQSQQHSFTFPSNLTTFFTANHHLLLATSAFASLPDAPTPDFTIPDGFLFVDGGRVSLPFSIMPNSEVTYTSLPTDGVLALSVGSDGTTITITTNSPTNFAGQTGTVPEPVSGVIVGLGSLMLAASCRRRRG
ncbi:MAG TPA: hypothetical protein VF184_11390 [Phycisphaeraceae bacterium]